MLEEPNRLLHIDADKYDLHYSAAILATLRTPSSKPMQYFRYFQSSALYPKAETKAVSLRQHSV
jgi:hypothetical protein